jgi:AcrR family transcriptional regulator
MHETRISSPHIDIKESIICAVGRLLSRYGYKKMTVEDIAHEAGIGKGTLYLYFPSKEEIALGWIDNLHKLLINELWEIAKTKEHPEEKLVEMLRKRVLFRFDQAQDFAESLDDIFSAIRVSLFVRREKYRAEEIKIFSYVLEEGINEGAFRQINIEDTSLSLLLATNSLLPYSLSVSQLGRRDEIEKKILDIANLLLNGLHKR